MQFPNAAKGIKRIYTAEILKLIAYILFGAAAVVGAVALFAADEGAGTTES